MACPWKKKKHDVSHWDPKCQHSIVGDSNVFSLLMACEVLAAANGWVVPLLILEIHV